MAGTLGIMRKSFRAFMRAWFDKPPGDNRDALPLDVQVTPEVCLADWTALDSGPVLQRGAATGTASVDGRGQAWPILEAPRNQVWRIERIAAVAPDGGIIEAPRIGWAMRQAGPLGATFSAQAPIPEGQGLKPLDDFQIYYGDLNDSQAAYYFGRIGTGTAAVNRIWHTLGDGEFLYLRIDTGQSQGNAIEFAVYFAALRNDEVQQLREVGRETYRGGG